MLHSPTLEMLKAMKLNGMVQALEDQFQAGGSGELSFEERFGLLVTREYEARNNRRLQARLREARLRYQACLEDLHYTANRSLDKTLILGLASCGWIRKSHNVLITGPTGVGKSFLGCALGHRACMEGFRVAYLRTPRMLRDLATAKGDGSYIKKLEKWTRTDLLILDDWGVTPMGSEACRDLLEILEDRYQKTSTVITSQVPLDDWHKTMKSPTLADAILDRLFHNAYRIQLKGESKRKSQTQPKTPEP
jgi:DNA replication protein DnaC